MDLIYVMAVCMNIDDDKFVWYAEDFAAAVAQLSDPDTTQVPARMKGDSYTLLMQLAYSICGLSYETTSGQTNEQGLDHGSRRQVQQHDMSFTEFSKSTAKDMVSPQSLQQCGDTIVHGELTFV